MRLLKQQRGILGAYCCFSRMLLPDRGRRIVSESTWTLWGGEHTVWDSIDAQLSPNKPRLIGRIAF